MNVLYIERSATNGRNGVWIEELKLDPPPDRIVVGIGPGSFAGIRAALAFAQGYALGRKCEVLGLPSPCALAGNGKLAVIGDARQGKAWVALFDGYCLEKDIFQVEMNDLMGTVPSEDGVRGAPALPGYRVVSPDDGRIGGFLRGVFGERYLGGQTPTAEGLRAFAEAHPDALVKEPLPIYLNPAVRGNPSRT